MNATVKSGIRAWVIRALLMFMLSIVSVTAVSGSDLMAASRVQAASSQKIYFKDGSGKYLEKIGKKYYLRNKKGKKLTGIQYLSIPKTGNLGTGHYWFDEKGMLVQKRTVLLFEGKTVQTVHGVTFSGYHFVNGNGRFITNAGGIYKINNLKCGNKTFNGYYFLDKAGRLSNKAQLRYLEAKTVNGVNFKTGYYYFDKYGKLNKKARVGKLSSCTVNKVKFSAGYYYFDSNGRMHTEQTIRKLNTTAGSTKLSGKHLFNGANGRLNTKKGWTTYNGKKYYTTKWGKIYTSRWIGSYYVQSDGTMAVNKKISKGVYVDSDGKKCTQEQFEMGSLKTQIQSMIKGYSGNWSVYVKNLETGSTININEVAMYPASTIKAFVMASTYDQIKKGNVQETAQIQTLLKNMITISDNESYNELVKRQTSSRNWISGTKVVNTYLKNNGFTKTGCHSTLHPAYSSRQSDGYSNTASARDCGLLLERIYKGTCVSKTYSQKMLNLLLGQQRRWKIPSGIPAGVKVANKTGETSTTQHDMAIVFGPKTDYIICVFSSGCSEYTGCNGIRNISSKVYSYLN